MVLVLELAAGLAVVLEWVWELQRAQHRQVPGRLAETEAGVLQLAKARQLENSLRLALPMQFLNLKFELWMSPGWELAGVLEWELESLLAQVLRLALELEWVWVLEWG